jgi:Cu/Zn superoxide dismutase
MHGGNITGSIRVKETASGLELDANLSALPQGDVSLIVHAHGDCSSADGSSAGEAFDLGMPAAAAKGSLALVRADRSGKATAKETFQGASLHGERSLLGRSVMLHEGAVSASGGLGKPLACAVFGIAREYEHGATK